MQLNPRDNLGFLEVKIYLLVAIYQVLDFGYVPFQHRFNRSAFEDMVKNTGLKIVKSLDRGEVYDQTQRALLYETDRTLFGEYELRYWVSR